MKFAQNCGSQSNYSTLSRDFKIPIFRFVREVTPSHLQNVLPGNKYVLMLMYQRITDLLNIRMGIEN